MNLRVKRLGGPITIGLCLATACLLALSSLRSANAQQFLNTRAIGGVLVDPQGMLTSATRTEIEELRRMQAEVTSDIPQDMAGAAPLRKISLARVNRLLRESVEAGRTLPADVLCLGGLQDISYVIGDPERNDIYLVGMAEGWRSSTNGVLVGKTTGRAVMLLDDLIVALRSLARPQPEVITCSINPRAETLPALQDFTRRIARNTPPEIVAQQLENLLGPQEVSVTGVPTDSHFARVLVAADYRMKRLGLGLDPAPISGLPPFTIFVRAQKAGMMPRWWLVPEVAHLAQDPEGLVWQIPPVKVKTLTESQFIAVRHQAEKSSATVPGAERWAEVMTDRFDELAQADPIFDQLRNCMELAVAAAVIVAHKLPERTGADLSFLLGERGFERAHVPPARFVPTRSVIVPAGRSTLIASGGVEINPWAIVARCQQSENLREVRLQITLPDPAHWWSN